METRIGSVVLVALLVLGSAGVACAAEKPPRPLIQVAILLDTSNSMDGLIDQAKAQLWKMVNEFAAMKRDGHTPDIRVALYEYGNNRLPASEIWIRLVLPLTTDLDKVSEELFALRTNGGTECCGTVIKAAVENLQWSTAPNDLKVIIIAGNEPFTQGKVDYRESCKAAIAKGIIINTIHCGREAAGINGKWKDGALLADGQFLCINQDRKIIHIAAPQDKELAKLSTALNTTYVPYGNKGRAGMANQSAQDVNTRKLSPSVAAERAKTKSSTIYRNAAWDLVDAVREKEVKLEELKDEELPEAMRKMSVEERKVYVETQSKKRAELQAQIKKLSKTRDAYVAVERRKLAEKGEDTLDAAVIKAVRKQAAEKKFKSE